MLFADSQLKTFMEQITKDTYPQQTFRLVAHQEAMSSISFFKDILASMVWPTFRIPLK